VTADNFAPETRNRQKSAIPKNSVDRLHTVGAQWETPVVNQWLRRRHWLHPAATLWYWRDQGGNEVYLLIELDQRLIAIECKRAERPDPRTTRPIERLTRLYGEDALAHA